ncbi:MULTISPECIES: hypothetical protein [unclassified Pseudomonas]|uniref:hypothetical protein n=1 Tax=unclassified Pseudomonas TaxID=196821 RepID=UPI00224A6B17|nr:MULTISPECIES: hypothetical protein [unclassified Pseudomonas]MCX2890616.1 hypothetical protein [Pseudomonas sp. DCB_BI]
MLSDTLKQFDEVYDKLWREIREEDGSDSCFSPEDISVLERLIYAKIFHLKAFEILLKCAPSNALDILKMRYLSLDLANNSKDHVADLEVMLSDVNEILGRDALEELLSCSEFLLDNMKNQRVVDAIEFSRNAD